MSAWTVRFGKLAAEAFGAAAGLTLLLIMSGCAPLAVAPPLPPGTVDGPYVSQSQHADLAARWVQEIGPGKWQVFSDDSPRNRLVGVPAVGSLPQLSVKLRGPAANAADEIRVASDTPIFVIADTHGEYEILAELLQRHGVTNDSMHWSFGSGRLVVLGDVFDRGPHHLEILWLIYQIEAEATAKGGGVHLVLGNHETMILRDDLRYLNPKYTRSTEVLGAASYAELVGSQTVLGQWLRSKPSVIRLNDLLLLHGGISPAIVKAGLSLEEINMAVRSSLSEAAVDDADGGGTRALVMGAEGPHWYRGYFALDGSPPIASREDVETVLRQYEVRRILVGHTQMPAITPLFEGKVIAVQVYPHVDEQSGRAVFEGLLIEDGKWYRAKVGGSLELLQRWEPEDGGGLFAASRSMADTVR